MVGTPSVHSSEDKLRALQRALASSTLARSDKLKQFLTYLCEMEMAGRGAELSEYDIGVKALGRGPDFSPVDDSIVRSTAYVLRQKLQDLYSKELSGEVLRIELPKGSYVPQYVAAPATAAAIPEPATQRWRTAAIFAAGLLAGGVLVGIGLMPLREPSAPDILRRAWGPLAVPGADVLISVSNPPQLVVRRTPEGALPPSLQPLPSTIFRPTEPWRLRPDWRDNPLSVEWSETSPHLGDAVAAIMAAKTLTALGAGFHVVSTKSIYVPAFNARNLVLIGSPEYSGTVARLLGQTPFDIRTDQTLGKPALFERAAPRSQPLPFKPRPRTGGKDSSYGLITAVPSEGSADRSRRTLVFSGTSPAAAQAAAEYFSSTAALDRLEAAFRAAGQAGIPPAFQVVVRCVEVNGLLVSYDYETLRVLDPRLPLR